MSFKKPVRAKGCWLSHSIPDVWLEKITKTHPHSKPIELQKVLILATTEEGDCNEYLLLAKKFPWQMTEREKSLTQSELDAIFDKYVSVLTDEPIEIQYMELDLGD